MKKYLLALVAGLILVSVPVSKVYADMPLDSYFNSASQDQKLLGVGGFVADNPNVHLSGTADPTIHDGVVGNFDSTSGFIYYDDVGETAYSDGYCVGAEGDFGTTTHNALYFHSAILDVNGTTLTASVDGSSVYVATVTNASEAHICMTSGNYDFYYGHNLVSTSPIVAGAAQPLGFDSGKYAGVFIANGVDSRYSYMQVADDATIIDYYSQWSNSTPSVPVESAPVLSIGTVAWAAFVGWILAAFTANLAIGLNIVMTVAIIMWLWKKARAIFHI